MTDSQVTPALTPEEWRDVVAVGACQALTHAKTRKGEAAILLYGQPFGFTHDDVAAIRDALDSLDNSADGINPTKLAKLPPGDPYARLRSLADRIAALLPPETHAKA